MHRPFIRTVILAVAACGAAGQADDDAPEAFTPLFDGKTLQGWHALPGGSWQVKDGLLVGTGAKTPGGHFEGSLFVPLPGDANLDRVVDYLDYVALKRHVAMAGDASWGTGDFHADQAEDRSDFLVLRGNFGRAVQGAGVLPASGEAPAADEAAEEENGVASPVESPAMATAEPVAAFDALRAAAAVERAERTAAVPRLRLPGNWYPGAIRRRSPLRTLIHPGALMGLPSAGALRQAARRTLPLSDTESVRTIPAEVEAGKGPAPRLGARLHDALASSRLLRLALPRL
jgi:hypothetical protein